MDFVKQKEELVGKNNIDIEQIMAEIRQEIQEKGFTDDAVSFDEIVAEPYSDAAFGDDLGQDISLLITTGNIPWARPIPRGIKGFFMKVIRKLVRFYIIPIVLDQNEYNQRTASVISRMYESIKNLDEVSEKLNDLHSQLESMVGECDMLNGKYQKGKNDILESLDGKE